MIGTILGILGILITLVFGGYSIWVYKKSKKNVSLEFRNKECYSLFREDVNRLNIEIVYNKTALNNTLVLLKATLLNTGHIDIDQNRIYKPLKIKSSETYKWLEATVTGSPSGAQTNIQLLNEQEVEITWDLLKQNESIEIEALVEITGKLGKEVEKGNDFFNNLTFDYRITDLNSIHKEKQISSSSRFRSIYNKFTKVTGVISILVGIIFLSFELFPELNFMDKQVVSYAIKKDNNELVSIISSKSSGEITLQLEGDKKQEFSVEEFNKSYKIQRIEKTTSDPENSLFHRIIGIVYVIMGAILLILQWRRKRKKAANTA